KLWAGIRTGRPDWIDRAVGRNASVAILRTASTSDETVWENEFFNRSVRTIYFHKVDRVPDPLPERALAGGVRVQYVLAADAAGSVVARDAGLGMTLFHVDGPLVVPTHVSGLYPNDTWSRRRVVYSRTHCSGGRLSVALGSDPSLFTRAQTVIATEHGRVVGRARIAPAGTAQLVVPLHPVASVCTVSFLVARPAVPGHGDSRALGAHFFSFDYGS